MKKSVRSIYTTITSQYADTLSDMGAGRKVDVLGITFSAVLIAGFVYWNRLPSSLRGVVHATFLVGGAVIFLVLGILFVHGLLETARASALKDNPSATKRDAGRKFIKYCLGIALWIGFYSIAHKRWGPLIRESSEFWGSITFLITVALAIAPFKLYEVVTRKLDEPLLTPPSDNDESSEEGQEALTLD